MLSDLQCKHAEAREKLYRLSDKDGLALAIHPTGGKYWQGRYRFEGVPKTLSLGTFPDLSVALARKEWAAARTKIALGIDPMAERKQRRQQRKAQLDTTVGGVSAEWFNTVQGGWRPRTTKNVWQRLKLHVIDGQLGARPFADVKAADVVQLIRSIESTGAGDMAGRIGALLSRIGAYAARCGYIEYNPAADLRDVLKPRTAGHFAALTHHELPELLHKIDTNETRMYASTLFGMQLLMLTLVRTNELIEAPWSEFTVVDGRLDLSSGVWVIPPARMKSKRAHTVPLSIQTKALLHKLHSINGGGKWVLPGQQPNQHLSDGAILAALKRMGYAGRMTGHGFRSLGMSTIMEVLDYPFDVVDLQLAHQKADKVRMAYDRAEFLPTRQKMMQAWADYLDAQRLLSR